MNHQYKLKTTRASASSILGAIFFLILNCIYFGQANASNKNTPIVRIAAIVNNKIISTSDLNKRIRLVAIMSKIKVGASNRRQFQRNILNQLIDEELENQEIERLRISISKEEINSAKSIMERRFNIPKGKLSAFISNNQIDKTDAISQLRTSLGWTRAVQKRFSTQLKINDSDVETLIKKITNSIGRPQFNVSEILISVSEHHNNNRSKELAYRLYNELKNGAQFSQIARQFSAAASAINGGKMGWINAKQLSTNLDTPLSLLKIGNTTEPIRTINGYHILRLDGRRTLMEFDPLKIRVTLLQMLLPLKTYTVPNSSGKLLPKIQASLSKTRNCSEFRKLAISLQNSVIRELGDFYMGELSKELRALVKDLKVGTPTSPIKVADELSIMNVCKRELPPSNIPSREQIRRKLLGEKLENLARKYLYELRRDAFIEIRI